MNTNLVESLLDDWNEVYKKGQLGLWILLSISDSEKYAAEIMQFMYDATGGLFAVKEQSLYRALRRFKTMGLVSIREHESPSGGPRRKYYSLTPEGEAVLGRFVGLHIAPLLQPSIHSLLQNTQQKGNSYDQGSK